jgi:hypothetical protein
MPRAGMPNRPIRMIVSLRSGGTDPTHARPQKLASSLAFGRVDNRPGA